VSLLAAALLLGSYLDPQYGMVSNNPHFGNGPNCDNYYLFTAEAHEIDNTVPIDFLKFFDASVESIGLFQRFPGRHDDISKDEIVGAASIDEYAAIEIFAYGETHHWDFNVANPGDFEWRYWLGRFLDVRPFVKAAAGFSLNVYEQMLWASACVTSCWSKYEDTGDKLYMYTEIKKLEGRNWLTDRAIYFWKWKMQRQYTNGPRELRGIYFGANHPLSLYSSTRF
jgi:hypothetical protein